MTLLTIASKQIWPQVLGFLHLNPSPDRLVLLHTNEEDESCGPAMRLKEFFSSQKLIPDSSVELVQVPHDRFGDVMEAFGSVAERLGLDETNCKVNFTGGNKLMAHAATEWCRRSGTQCFYLERGHRVFTFQPEKGDLIPSESRTLDPHLARDLEPLALLRCQLPNSEVTAPGQRLVLNQRGHNLPEREFGPLLKREGDFTKFLEWDVEEQGNQPGFALEFATAAALLKLGVPVVQRGIHLAPRGLRGLGHEEGERDLVFNWAGKLWVVDCKDRNPAEARVDKLRTEILKQVMPTPRLARMLENLEDELRQKDLHPLKEDLLAVAEVGGLLGRAICVRRSPLPPQAMEFAESRRIRVVLKDHLIHDLHSILNPG